MSARPLVLAVGDAAALRSARRDARLDLRRCEDALDALALACSLPVQPVALVLDHTASSREDMPRLIDAAREAGLPSPLVLSPTQEDVDLWEFIHAEHDTPEHDADDESLAGVTAFVGAIEALLEGELALGTFLEACADFGVRLAEHPEGGLAHAAITDDDGDAIAFLVGPHALEDGPGQTGLLSVLARGCSALAALDEAVEDLIDEASTDATTGLPDRGALLEELEARIDEARPAREEFSLTLVSLEDAADLDPEWLYERLPEDSFAGVASWGVIALLDIEPEHDDVFAGLGHRLVRVAYPWDGSDPIALLEEGESVLRTLVRTDTV